MLGTKSWGFTSHGVSQPASVHSVSELLSPDVSPSCSLASGSHQVHSRTAGDVSVIQGLTEVTNRICVRVDPTLALFSKI